MTDPNEITEPMPMWMWCDEDPHPLRPGCTRSHHNVEIMQNYRLRARLEASVSVQNAVILQLCEVANALGIPAEMSNDPPAMTRETAVRILALRARVAELEQQVADARTESAALLAAVREIEAGTSCELVTIGAYRERFGDKPIMVHPDRLDGIWRAIKARAECAMKWAAGALDSRARCEQLEQQVAALANALAGMTRSVCRCYEHNDDLGDAMDLAKDALRAIGRKP